MNDDVIDCLAPSPILAPERIKLPPGAWDTHAHVIGSAPQHPFVLNRNYTPPPASVEDYIAMLDTVGIEYGVIVPISVHGNDNRLLLTALSRFPSRLRGVASISGTESDEELSQMRESGVCGVRINELFTGGSGADHLATIASRCKQLDWHLDLALHGNRLRTLLPILRELKVRLVIDHMGFCPAEMGIANPDFQAVLELLRLDNVWVKLSGAYRLSAIGGPQYADVAPFVDALFRTAPSRTVWAADWPHVAIKSQREMPQAGALLDALAKHLVDEEAFRRVMVDNPLALYGRPGTAVGNLFT